MFDEDNELKNPDEYRVKMDAMAIDCKEGNVGAISCHHAAEFYSMIDKNYEKSSEIFKHNCDRYSYAASCFEIGTSYLIAKGVEENIEKSTEYLDKACNRKHFGGCHLLGKVLYSKGMQESLKQKAEFKVNLVNETPKELLKPLSYFEKACKYGYGDSCSFLGMHYLKKVAGRNPEKAVKYLSKACDSFNNVNACYNLAVLFKLGDVGVDKDLEKHEHYKNITLREQKNQGLDLSARKSGKNGDYSAW